MQLSESVTTPTSSMVQLAGGDTAIVQNIPAGQEILGELDPSTGILYNPDGTQTQLPLGAEFKTIMTSTGQVRSIYMIIIDVPVCSQFTVWMYQAPLSYLSNIEILDR